MKTKYRIFYSISLLLYINCGTPQSTDQSSFSKPYTKSEWENTNEGTPKTLWEHFFPSSNNKSVEPSTESFTINYSGPTIGDYVLNPDEYAPKSMRDRLRTISEGNEIVSPTQTDMQRQHSGYIHRNIEAQERELEVLEELGQTDTEGYQRLVEDYEKSKEILEDMKYKASYALRGDEDDEDTDYDADYDAVRETGDFYANPIDDTLTRVDTGRVVYFPESEPEKKSWLGRFVESLIGSDDNNSNNNDSGSNSSPYGKRKDDPTCFLEDGDDNDEEEESILSGFDNFIDNFKLW